MSVSLSKFVGKAEVSVKEITTGGKVAGVKPGMQGTLEAKLPEGLTAKVIVTDGTIKSARGLARAGA